MQTPKRLLISVLAIILSLNCLVSCIETSVTPNNPTVVPTTSAPETTTPAPETTTPAPETTTPAPETTAPAPETTAPHTHIYGAWEVTKAPTCTQSGKETRTCECGETQTRATAANGHAEVILKGKNATCTEAGLTDGKKCSVCGAVTAKQSKIAAVGHSYEDGACIVCGDWYSLGLEYALNKDEQSYTLVGIGSCTDTEVVIPAEHNGLPVTEIGDEAFFGLNTLTSIKINEGIKKISYAAFQDCTSLVCLSIPNSICDAKWDIIENCPNLKYNSYDNALYIGNDKNPYVLLAKAVNQSIFSCEIHPETRIIGAYSFNKCHSLSQIVIPDKVKHIGSRSFFLCLELVSVTLPESLLSFGNEAFNGCVSLIEVYNLSTLDLSSGSGANSLIHLFATHIYDSADIESKLHTYQNEFIFYVNGSEVKILTYIGNETKITLPRDYNGMSYDFDWGTFRANEDIISITLSDGIEYMDLYNLGFCNSLTEIIIPATLKDCGKGNFDDFTTLTDIYYGGTMAQWESIVQGKAWRGTTPMYTVHCSDGDIAKG